MKADSVRIIKLIGGNIMQSTVVTACCCAPWRAPSPAWRTPRSPSSAAASRARVETQGRCSSATPRTCSTTTRARRRRWRIIAAVAKTGTNVVVSGGSVSEMALHFIEKYKMMRAVHVQVGPAAPCNTTGPRRSAHGPGHARGDGRPAVFQKEFGQEGDGLRVAADMDRPVASIVLRNSWSVNNDLERACDDGLSCVQQLCKEPGFCGAGARRSSSRRSSGRWPTRRTASTSTLSEVRNESM